MNNKFKNIFPVILFLVLIYHLVLSVFGFFTTNAEGLKQGEYFVDTVFVLLLLLNMYLSIKRRMRQGEKIFLIDFCSITNCFIILFLLWTYFLFLRDYFSNGVLSMIRQFDILLVVVIKIFLAYFFAQHLRGKRKSLRYVFLVIILFTSVTIAFLLVELIVHGSVLYTNDFFHFKIDANFFDWAGIGFGRLQINGNYNLFGMYAKTLIMLCVYLLFEIKNRWRFLLFIPASLFYVLLVLTDCRAGLLATAVGLSIVAALYVWIRLVDRNVSFRIAVVALTFFMMFLSVDLMRKPVYHCFEITHSFFLGEGTVDSDAVVRETERKLLSGASGRKEIYMAALNSMKDPEIALYGVTPARVSYQMNQMLNHSLDWYTHNELLEVMLATGFPGLILFIGWLGLATYCGMRVFFNVGNLFPFSERVLMIVALTELVNNMFEACLTFKDNLSGFIFYLAAGYAVALAQRSKGKVDFE